MVTGGTLRVYAVCLEQCTVTHEIMGLVVVTLKTSCGQFHTSPFKLTPKGLRSAELAAQQSGCVLDVAHTLHAHPVVVVAKELRRAS